MCLIPLDVLLFILLLSTTGSNEILFHPRVAAFTIDFKMLSAHIIIKYSGANIASPLLCLRASTYIDN